MLLNTVSGPIAREQLGVVATHEHVLLDQSNHYQSIPTPGITDPGNQKVEMLNLGILSRDCFALKDNTILDNEEEQTEEVAFFKRAGGDTLFNVYSNIVAMWCFALPCAALGAFYFHWPVVVVFACTCLDEISKMPWVIYHYRKYKWVNNITA